MGASKAEETFQTPFPCRDGEIESQRRRKAKDSQLVVAGLRPLDTQALGFSSSQGPMDTGIMPPHPTAL